MKNQHRVKESNSHGESRSMEVKKAYFEREEIGRFLANYDFDDIYNIDETRVISHYSQIKV